MNEILFDTNALIYSIDEESKYYHSVQKLLNNKSNKLFTTSKNISEFLSVVTRHPKSSLTLQEFLIKINSIVTANAKDFKEVEEIKLVLI